MTNGPEREWWDRREPERFHAVDASRRQGWDMVIWGRVPGRPWQAVPGIAHEPEISED